ncbi:MAG TPA: zeta toxin family protein [Acidobacteriaceae bacterium]|nr:zeta toxin family protein [Acidobacteriaceae bacterium]
MASIFDRRPVLVALAGPNGAGKTTFYHAHLQSAGLRLVNADGIARELGIDAYPAAKVAGTIREQLVAQQESFVFETVFSDPVGDKISFLQKAGDQGYTLILCFIGLSNPGISEERVAMRVSQGGHDVPAEKIQSRFPRVLHNLRTALNSLPHVRVYDNSDLRQSYRLIAIYEHGEAKEVHQPVPKWLLPLLPGRRR